MGEKLMISILSFVAQIVAPTFWAFMTGAAQLPAARRPKSKIITWQESLTEIQAL